MATGAELQAIRAQRAAQLGGSANATLKAAAAGTPTPSVVQATAPAPSAQSVYNQIASGQLIPNTNPNNTAWQSIPMDVRQQAYSMWDNAIKSGQVTFNEMGIPSTLGSAGKVPTPGSPIDASKLNPNQGYVDLKNILGASINGDNLLDGIDSQTAGLMALLGKQSEADMAVEGFQADLIKNMESLGGQSADLQAALESQGVNQAYDQVKQLNLRAAQLQGQLEKFDVETMQGNENLGNQPIAQEFVTGQQAQYQRQRNLSKMAQVAELSATTALSQAYAGNAELGMELAAKSVDLKYAPILNKIETLKTQLGFAMEKATKQDAKRMTIINNLITARQEFVEGEKAKAKQIESLVIDAALNGAPLSIVNQMRASGDAAVAASIGGQFLKGNMERVGGGRSGGGGSSKGASVINGVDVSRLSAGQKSALGDYLSQVSSYTSKEEALAELNKYQSSIIAQVGDAGLQAIVAEVERLFPDGGTVENVPDQPFDAEAASADLGERVGKAGEFYKTLPGQAVDFAGQTYKTGEAMVKTVYNYLFGK